MKHGWLLFIVKHPSHQFSISMKLMYREICLASMHSVNSQIPIKKISTNEMENSQNMNQLCLRKDNI